MSIVFEKDVRFSKSIIWQMQKEYFASLGIDAWDHQVPFYITSNPVIAKHYANLVYAMMLDNYDINKNDVYYILELGTGSGQFSCYFLNFLTDLLKDNSKQDLNFCYVMTDFTHSNLDFWKEHPKLKNFVKAGVLDFAIYNLETQNDIQLVNKKIKLDKKNVNNPITVISNYIFDTVLSDCFYVKDSVLHESRVSLSTSFGNYNEDNNKPKKLEDINTEFSYKSISKKYYTDDDNDDNDDTRSESHKKILDKVVFSYINDIKSGAFLFPLGALDCIDHLSKISDDGLMILSTDKGMNHLFEIEGRGNPKIAFHGSFSVTVNFDAINRYVKLKDGLSLFPDPRDGIKTALFLMGFNKNNKLINLKNIFYNNLDRLTPADFFHYHRLLRDATPEARSAKMMLTHFNMCLWDPYTFSLYNSELIKKVPKASRLVQEGFLFGMRKMDKLVYFMPGAKDHYFNMAFFCHILEDYKFAAELYHKSLNNYSASYAHVYNLGLCYYALDDKTNAILYFEKAVLYIKEEQEQTNKKASQWLLELKE